MSELKLNFMIAYKAWEKSVPGDNFNLPTMESEGLWLSYCFARDAYLARRHVITMPKAVA